MNETNRLALHLAAISKYGEKARLDKVAEELGECIAEISRLGGDRGNLYNVAREVADALMVLECVRLLLPPGAVSEAIAWKANRFAKDLGLDGVVKTPGDPWVACPYCGYASMPLRVPDAEHLYQEDCEECSRTFTVEPVMEMTYKTQK